MAKSSKKKTADAEEKQLPTPKKVSRKKTGDKGTPGGDTAPESLSTFQHLDKTGRTDDMGVVADEVPEAEAADTGMLNIVITKGKVHDDFLNFNYKVVEGISKGAEHKVTGMTNIIHKDLKEAFARFNFHLAAIMNEFKNEADQSFENLHNHANVGNYKVTGFTLSGEEVDDSVKVYLIGTVWLPMGHANLTTPAIALSNSSYKHIVHLKECIELAQSEALLYKNGKRTPRNDDEKKVIYKQPKIKFDPDADKKEAASTNAADNDLGNEEKLK